MGIIMRTAESPDLHNYVREYNDDGSEKHIVCNGARFHVVSWDGAGEKCSESNCEINRRRKTRNTPQG